MSRPSIVLPILVAILAFLVSLCKDPVPQHDSVLTGQLYYEELMATRSAARFLHAARMDRETFLSLLALLESKGLKDGRKLCTGEKLFILLEALKGSSCRECAERWQHSTATISSAIHSVMEAMLQCQETLFIKPRQHDPIHERLQDPKYAPFVGCIGALDGTHIPAFIALDKQAPFRNRKGFISQNVLAVCNLDMTFSYILAGWEGSAHDGKVYNDALGKGLPLLEGKFYLGDAGYGLSHFCLTPYRGVRYHLKEWARRDLRPQNKEELYNLRHSSLRNVIERIFGVLKKRFPILVVMPSYSFLDQIKLVKCAMLIHNFIRCHALYEDIFYRQHDAEVEADRGRDDGFQDDAGEDAGRTPQQLKIWRDTIADELWEQYQTFLAARMR
jgi:hypothetical protein